MIRAEIKSEQPTKSWLVEKPDKNGHELASQIMNIMEQGIAVWSANGFCELHNTRVYDVLELETKDIGIGTPLEQFLTSARDRGEFSTEALQEKIVMFRLGKPFQYDCLIPSGAIVSANARPMREGGYVVTFTDVSIARTAVADLAVAKAEAENAQQKATEVLEDERARQREAALLSQLDEWLQSCKSLSELYSIVTTFMNKVLPATRGQLFIYSKSRDLLDIACTWNSNIQQTNVTPDSCWALRRGRSYSYDPDELCFVCDHVSEKSRDNVPERFLCIPVVAHGDTVGLLHLEFEKIAQNPMVIDAEPFAMRCGEHISMAIANVKLRDELQDQSTRDPLTGLYNRRFFVDALRREVGQASATQSNFALVSVDADKFKNFNDNHGHDAGDVVLQAIAEKMITAAGPDGVACRMGGEEFSLLIPFADRTRASAIVEDLRLAISAMQVKYIGGPLPKITVSAGLAVYPTHGTQPQDLLKAADVALYEAKDAGRDCWRLAEGDGMISFA